MGATIAWWVPVPALVGTAGALLEGVGWPLDLLVHFRPQYAVMALIGVISFALLRRPVPVAINALVLLLNIVPVAGMYYSGRYTPDDSTHYTALLVNVNTANPLYDRVLAAIDSSDPDVVALLEVNQTWLAELDLPRRGYGHNIIHPRNDNFGLAIYSRDSIEESSITHLGSSGVPVALARVNLAGRDLQIVAAHLVPPTSFGMARHAREQADDLAELLAGFEAGRNDVMMLADLNATPWSERFDDIVAFSGLRDARDGHGLEPTWPSWAPPLQIPIDHCLVSERINIHVLRSGEAVGSDHYPLVVEFSRR